MKARVLFQRMTSREKTLLCAFVWIILILCFAFALKNFRVFLAGWSETGRSLQYQQADLDQKPDLDAALKQELAFFQSGNTYDSAALTGRVEQLATQSGISNFTYNTRSEEKDIHVEHTIRLNVRDTPLDKLMAFDEAIDGESPYINKVSVKLGADRRGGELLDATILLNSFELKDGALGAVQ